MKRKVTRKRMEKGKRKGGQKLSGKGRGQWRGRKGRESGQIGVKTPFQIMLVELLRDLTLIDYKRDPSIYMWCVKNATR